VCLVLLSLAIAAPPVRGVDIARISSTAGVQFESAVNWAFCGRYGQITSTSPQNRAAINLAELRDPSAYDRSAVDTIERRVGSRYLYCLQPASPAVVEQGMVLIEAAVLKMAPRTTLKGIARLLAVARFVLIAVFGWFLLWAGISLPVSGLLVGLAIYLTTLQGGSALYSAYPFILPVVLAGIGLAGFGLEASSPWMLPAICLGMGFWAGFLGCLRTSHYPMAVAVSVLFIAWSGVSWRRSLAGVLATALGLFIFDRAFVAPLRAQGIDSHHVVAHSLVLGLDNPPNELSRREGIIWDDSKGIVFARRIDPQAEYLGPTYESSLFTYYTNLWRRHPGEMSRIYAHKVVSTTESVFSWLGSTRADLYWDSKNGWFLALCGALVRPLSAALTLGGTLTLLVLLGIFLRSRWGVTAAWPLVTVGICGGLGYLEAAIILGSVNLWYNAVAIYATLFAGVILVELLLRLGLRRAKAA
jgi:hypothetical protein